ncbi:MAG TPA: exodeoxyribonuclease III [Dongiaceae bacterium]
MRLVTWNVNSVRLRQENLRRLVETLQPDVICLQETKVIDDHFPHDGFAALGYGHHVIHGMKSYNGVAIFSRLPLSKPQRLPWCGKEDRRHAAVLLPNGVELHNFYVPAGGDIPDPKKNDKFAHKLQFVAEMKNWSAEMKRRRRKAILVGDLNIAPLENDVWSHKQLLDVVSHTPVEVDGLTSVQKAGGWVDAVRHFVPPTERLYSWWSYRAQDWAASDRGRRLDHVWVSGSIAANLRSAQILREARGWATPSDHVPVIVDFA